jgi:two-component system cell cycle response regulator
MTTLVQAASTVRKRARASFGYVTAGCVALLDLLGAFRDPRALGVEHALVAGAWLCVFVARVGGQLRDERRTVNDGILDLEQSFLLLAATHAVLQLLGGLLSPLYPVLYVLVAFIGSFAARGQGRFVVLSAVAFEAPLYFFTEGHSDAKPYALHAIFLALFGLINVIFTQAELTRRGKTPRTARGAPLPVGGHAQHRAARRRASLAKQRRRSSQRVVLEPLAAQAHAQAAQCGTAAARS